MDDYTPETVSDLADVMEALDRLCASMTDPAPPPPPPPPAPHRRVIDHYYEEIKPIESDAIETVDDEPEGFADALVKEFEMMQAATPTFERALAESPVAEPALTPHEPTISESVTSLCEPEMPESVTSLYEATLQESATSLYEAKIPESTPLCETTSQESVTSFSPEAEPPQPNAGSTAPRSVTSLHRASLQESVTSLNEPISVHECVTSLGEPTATDSQAAPEEAECPLERWSDATSQASLPHVDPSEAYFTASSDVSLSDDGGAAGAGARREGAAAGHVAAMRERFESLTRAGSPCPDGRDVTPSPDTLA